MPWVTQNISRCVFQALNAQLGVGLILPFRAPLPLRTRAPLPLPTPDRFPCFAHPPMLLCITAHPRSLPALPARASAPRSRSALPARAPAPRSLPALPHAAPPRCI